jgi:hypothetical protein
MATRVDLNLPPRLLEAARATQAANRRQLQNRERQVRDAREIKRRLRKIEEEERRATKQRDLWKGAVPEFDSSRSQPFQRRQLDVPQRGELAKGYIQWVLDKSDSLDKADPVMDRYKLHSGDQQSSVTFEIQREFTAFGLHRSCVFPVGGNSLIFAGVSYVLSGGTPDWTVDCFHISRSNVRRISSPRNIIDSLLSFNPSLNTGFIDDPQEAVPNWPSGNPALFESTWRYGDVRSLQSANGIEQTEPPRYLTLATKRVTKSMTGRLFFTAERTGNGIAASWLNGSPRLANEEIYVYDYGEGITNFDPNEWPEFGSYLLAAWDWGKPALCRQLLLQLGFTPADFVP